jgi:antitoxin component of MazEF toxin-antitoxin module
MATTTLRQSGDSIILTIPGAIAQAMGAVAGSRVRMALQGRVLTITPEDEIEALVAGCTAENAHAPLFDGEVGAERF